MHAHGRVAEARVPLRDGDGVLRFLEVGARDEELADACGEGAGEDGGDVGRVGRSGVRGVEAVVLRGGEVDADLY